MWKLKNKLKRKFRSSKVLDCNSNRIDFDTLSFDSETAPPESEQSDTSAAHHPGVCADKARAIERLINSGSSTQSSSVANYSCCYNYNLHINYNVHRRLHPHHHHHHHHDHHPSDHHHHHHHEDTDGTPFGSTSCMTTGTVSDSSAEPRRPKKPPSKGSVSRKVRPMSSGAVERPSPGSSVSSRKISSEPDTKSRAPQPPKMKATRCASTSDLSSYKEYQERSKEPEAPGKSTRRPTRTRPRSASHRSARVDPNVAQSTADQQNHAALCRKLQSVSLDPANASIGGQTTELTDHDRRILHCMVLKRIKELEQLDEAVLAQQCWEQEKLFRRSLLDQQERNYRSAIRQKRTIEQIEIRNRRQRLARLEQQQIERIQNEISEKDIRSASLLKNIEIRKGIRECERRSRELKRLEDATVTHEEKTLDRDIWRQSLVETLEERAGRAEDLRRKVLEVYRRRLQIDNQLERKMHAHNLQQTIEQERYRLRELQERILVRESRFQQFKAGRKRIFDQLKNRAQATAALRDMVKASIGPGGASAQPSRPGSVVQRCGSSARSGTTTTADTPHRLLDVVRIN
ncbi:myotubularin-related protein DDB_G0290005 [Anopheles darlingi]|uniref:myotubularin-related protein DDB_G0290005 n=1 Tax=Anopheles darlingi TaxID=43151 RepID=UPI0021002BB8|nr:myotubularin-related protein DDB_G0290005 [Anopheles darlingi]